MCAPQMALRAMPLSAGHDFWLYVGLFIQLQLVAWGARLSAASDGDDIIRRARPPAKQTCTLYGNCGTHYMGKSVAMTRSRTDWTSQTSVSEDGMARRAVA